MSNQEDIKRTVEYVKANIGNGVSDVVSTIGLVVACFYVARLRSQKIPTVNDFALGMGLIKLHTVSAEYLDECLAAVLDQSAKGMLGWETAMTIRVATEGVIVNRVRVESRLSNDEAVALKDNILRVHRSAYPAYAGLCSWLDQNDPRIVAMVEKLSTRPMQENPMFLN